MMGSSERRTGSGQFRPNKKPDSKESRKLTKHTQSDTSFRVNLTSQAAKKHEFEDGQDVLVEVWEDGVFIRTEI